MKRHILVYLSLIYFFSFAFTENTNLIKETNLTLNGVTQTEIKNKDESTTYMYWLNNTQIATEQFSTEDHLIKRTGVIPDGIVVYITDNVVIKEVFFISNKRNGLSKEYYQPETFTANKHYYENGNIMIDYPDKFKDDIYKDATREIIEKSFYPNGALEEETLLLRMPKKIKIENSYKNDKREGTYRYFHENGAIRQSIPYRNDKVNGIYKLYFYDGSLLCEIPAKDDSTEGVSKTYYYGGALHEVITWKNDKQNGIYKEYYENGNLKFEATVKNDIEDGITKTYYENGALAKVTTYKNGKKNGSCKEYSEDGRIIFKGIFKDDLQQD